MRAIARALDRDDFEQVRAYLADECEYLLDGETLRGPTAVVASYAEASDWARRNLDAIRYESVVGEPAGDGVPVRFIDHLEHGGRTHRHECEQVFTVGPDGRVVRVVHRELPGQSEALAEFFRTCGLRRM